MSRPPLPFESLWWRRLRLHLYPHPRPDHESMTLTQAAEYWHALRELTLMHACELWAVRLFGPATLEEELRRVLHQLS